MSDGIEQFFRNHPVFTGQDLACAIDGRNRTKPNTLKNKLQHHLQQGHIVRIRRGLYASIPYGANATSYPINPYLVAASLAKDAVIAYHSALSFYGFAYSSTYRFIYLTQSKPKPIEFRGNSYEPATFPTALQKNNKSQLYVTKEDVQGIDARVTSKERTLVDVLDRPLLGGGWEEVFRSLNIIERLKLERVIDYALCLNNATTIAKLGFYLEKRQSELAIKEHDLKVLQKHCPKTPHYLIDRGQQAEKLVKPWNLIVPTRLIEQNWEESLSWENK